MKLFVFLIGLSFITFQPKDSFGSTGDTYDFSWLDPGKKIFVLQNRRFIKKGKLNFAVGSGLTTSGAFVDSFNFSGRGSYFFTEEFGIEFLYSKNNGKENSTAESVRNPGGAGSIPFRRIVDQYYGAYLSWSPFYSKINTFNQIIYLDILFNLGVMSMSESNNAQEVSVGGAGSFDMNTEDRTALSWDIGWKVYLSEYIDLRLDVTALHYQATSALGIVTNSDDKNWYSHYDMALSLGVRF
jgi:outer membrane beta-barrel protein